MDNKRLIMFFCFSLLTLDVYGSKEGLIYGMNKSIHRKKPMRYVDRVRRDVIAKNINPRTLYSMGLREYKRTGNSNNRFWKELRKYMVTRKVISRGR